MITSRVKSQMSALSPSPEDLLMGLQSRWNEIKASDSNVKSELSSEEKQYWNALLEDCAMAGRDISDSTQRAELNGLVREICDEMFWRTGEYPNVLISLPKAVLALQSGVKEVFPKFINVPSQNPFFIGREDLLNQLHQALRQIGKSAIKQAISGMGGVGKTQMAIAYAYQYQDEFKHILWAQADNESSLYESFQVIAQRLNLPHKTNQLEQVDEVKNWLNREKGWLLIFDNADMPELINQFLPNQFDGSVLLTSRAQAFDTIGVSEPVELVEFQSDEALEFLKIRTGRKTLSQEEEIAVQTIAEELGYLPLALEQAGAYIMARRVSFQKYLEALLRVRLELFEQSKPVAGNHKETVTTNWLLNFRDIEKESQATADVLRFCAFLSPSPIPLELLEQSADQISPAVEEAVKKAITVNDVIEPLMRYSLVRVDTQTQTFTVHRLIQAVVRDLLDEPAQHQWVERAIHALNQAFPSVEFENWPQCARLAPHGNEIVKWIEHFKIQFEEAGTLLNQLGSYFYATGRYSEVEPLFQSAVTIYKRQGNPESPETAQILNKLALLYKTQGQYEKAELLHQKVLAIWERQFGPDHPTSAQCLHDLAELYRAQGRYEEAEPLYDRALAIWERQFDPNHTTIAQSLCTMAAFYYTQGRHGKAEALYKQVSSIQEQQLGLEHPATAQSLHDLAVLYHTQGRYGEAEPLYQRVSLIREKQLGLEHPDTATGLNNLAGLYLDQGRFKEAEPLLRQALEIREHQLGPNHPLMASSLNNLAELYREQGWYKEAEPLYERALEIYQQVFSLEHLETVKTLNNLALLYLAQEKYKEAEPLLQQALLINQQKLGAEHPEIARIFNNLAELYRVQERNDEAEPLLRRTLAIWERVLGPEHPDTATALNNLANFLFRVQGNYSEAEPLLRRALAAREKYLGPDHPETANSFNNLGGFYFSQKKYEEAERLFRKAYFILKESLGQGHPTTGIAKTNLLGVLYQLGKNEEADALEREM